MQGNLFAWPIYYRFQMKSAAETLPPPHLYVCIQPRAYLVHNLEHVLGYVCQPDSQDRHRLGQVDVAHLRLTDKIYVRWMRNADGLEGAVRQRRTHTKV